MKYLHSYNESIRDQMTPVSDEQLKNSLGEEKYLEYIKLMDIEETLNKRPFAYTLIHREAKPMFLSVQTELNDFNIRYFGGKYVLQSMSNEFKFDTKKALINEMKNITLDCMASYEQNRLDEIDKIHKEIKHMKEEISYITKNF